MQKEIKTMMNKVKKFFVEAWEAYVEIYSREF